MKNIHLYILCAILLLFLYFFTYHVQSLSMEPFFISEEQNQNNKTTEKVDLKEDINYIKGELFGIEKAIGRVYNYINGTKNSPAE